MGGKRALRAEVYTLRSTKKSSKNDVLGAYICGYEERDLQDCGKPVQNQCTHHLLHGYYPLEEHCIAA